MEFEGDCGDWTGPSDWADDEGAQGDLTLDIKFMHDDVNIRDFLATEEADKETRDEGE
jgi:hypothetical protein